MEILEVDPSSHHAVGVRIDFSMEASQLAFTNFAAFLRQKQESKAYTPGSVVAARGLLSLALAAFAYPEVELPTRENWSIAMAPGGPSTINFVVPAIYGEDEVLVEFAIA